MKNSQSVFATEYDDAVRWIFDRINYERIRPSQSSDHFRLERIERLLSLIGSPQLRLPAIHIAGTKGKGSTAAILDSILRASGLRSGLFTSPHIHQFEERMKVGGEMPSPTELTALVSALRNCLSDAPEELAEDKLTYFEVATLLAWMFFDRKQTEYVVLETGLGGRLDCTNVCNPVATLITSISLDHMHILGDTIEAIASEKAGIIKPGVPVFCSATKPAAVRVIQERAESLGCEFKLLDRDFSVRSGKTAGKSMSQELEICTPDENYLNVVLNLSGRHQGRNAALAVATADWLGKQDQRLTPTSIVRGVAETDWPLRFEIFSGAPTFVLDVAHNPESISAMAATVTESFPTQRKVAVFGSSQDKDFAGMLKSLLDTFDAFVFTKFLNNPRAVAPSELHRLASEIAPERTKDFQMAANPTEAIRECRNFADDESVVAVSGSFFLAAEFRDLLLSRPEELA